MPVKPERDAVEGQYYVKKTMDEEEVLNFHRKVEAKVTIKIEKIRNNRRQFYKDPKNIIVR